MPKLHVIALLVADIHLSHKAPIARAAEPDWYAAQLRPLDQLQALRSRHNVPIICAGDIFHKWYSSPELINFAIKNLPDMIAIPGNHDIPDHNIEQLHRSAFHTLEQSGTIENMESRVWKRFSQQLMKINVNFHFHPFGYDLEGIPWNGDQINVIVLHRYCWTTGHSYPGAPKDHIVNRMRQQLKGYNLAVFGDNHDHFIDLTFLAGPVIYNCGCLIPRRSDEQAYEPSVGLLYSDGKVKRHKLDCSKDKWIDYQEASVVEKVPGLTEFIDELSELKTETLDFAEALKQFCGRNSVSEPVEKLIFAALEGHF